MAFIRTKDEIEKIVNDLGFNLLDEYLDRNYRRVVIQDNFGYKYNVQLNNLMKKDQGISFVDKSNPFSLENIVLWLKLNKKNFELCENNIYCGALKKLKFYHSFCNEIFYANWDHILQGNGCGICSGSQIGKYNTLMYLRPDLVDEFLYSEHNKNPDELTSHSNDCAYWKCKDCGHEWWAIINSRTAGRDCPNCADENKESKIATQLKKYILGNYIAKTEYKIFKNPESNYYLPYDIYIYDNIYIEIHGLQHYKFVKHFYKNKEEFEHRQYLDKIKREFAENNGIYIEVDLRKIKTVEEAIEYVNKYICE